MTDIEKPAVTTGNAKESSISDTIHALIEDGQTLVEAEIAYRKAQATFGVGEAKVIAVLLLLGLAFGFFTLLAIVVGLLLALTFYVGAWGALAVVGGVLVILTGLCLHLAVKRMSNAKAGLFGKENAQ